MRHRDRVLAALNHEEPDRCPMQVSFTPEFAARLGRDLGLAEDVIHNPHGRGNTFVLERALDQDMLLIHVGWVNSYYATDTYGDGGDSYVDEWGVRWKNVAYETKFGTGHYTEIARHPLAEDTAIDSYQPPDPSRSELYVEAEQAVREYGDEYWIVGVTVTTIFETAWALRGYAKTLMDLAVNPDFVERLFDIPFHYHLAAARKLVELGVDMIWIGDDVGTQHGMLVSPSTWRRFFKPRLATFISTLKAVNPDVRVAYHSDGAIYPIIPDLVEIGVDVLNPIQPRPMDPVRVKREYGDKLCFWGTIDEQYTLPFGTPAEVKNEVLTRLRTIGRDGGLILGPTHNVQLDTPLENFWAMVNTIADTPYGVL